MNLKAIRTAIYNLLDYQPELQAFKDQTDELVNEAYREIWNARRWNFGVKETVLEFYADITGERTGRTVTATKGSRSVGFSGPVGILDTSWEGQPVEIAGREYTISKITSVSLVLTEPFEEADVTTSDWNVKRRYYNLPQDCMEILSLSVRDAPFHTTGNIYGKLIPMLARTEESLNLRMDYTATHPEAYVLAAPKVVPAAETLAVQANLLSGVTTGFSPGGTLEFCWAFDDNGVVGPLSEPKTITIPELGEGDPAGSTFEINLEFQTHMGQQVIADGLQSQDRRPTFYEGLRKRLYFNSNLNFTTGERLGLPCWQEVIVGGPTRDSETYLDHVIVPDNLAIAVLNHPSSVSGSASDRRYIEVDGQHQRIRPYPRVDGYDVHTTEEAADPGVHGSVQESRKRRAILRYAYKPADLTKVTDSPAMPHEFHNLLVFKAMESVYLKLGNSSMSSVYRKRVEDAMKVLERRYLDRVDTLIRKGSFMSSKSGTFFDPTSLRHLG